MTETAVDIDRVVEMVPRTRGYRRWRDDVKAKIVAESFERGVRVTDIARKYDLASHQLSAWRKQARDGLLALPLETMEGGYGSAPPAFVPVSIMPDHAPPATTGVDTEIRIELGSQVTLRIPEGASVERVACLVQALQRASI